MNPNFNDIVKNLDLQGRKLCSWHFNFTAISWSFVRPFARCQIKQLKRYVMKFYIG